MNLSKRTRDISAKHAGPLRAGLLAIACMLLITPAVFAVDAVVRDRVFGDEFIVEWSPGVWSVDGDPSDGCVTFPDGTSTGPGNTMDADSVGCTPMPNGWEWSVTIPGPYTLHWQGHGLPPGIEFCVQIFYGSVDGPTRAFLDFDNDRLTVESPEGSIIYDGSYEGFIPGEYGLLVTEARRCGFIRQIPVPVENSTWGQVKSIYR